MIGWLVSGIAFSPRPRYQSHVLERWREVWDSGTIPSDVDFSASSSTPSGDDPVENSGGIRTRLIWVNRRDGHRVPAIHVSRIGEPQQQQQQQGRGTSRTGRRLTVLFSHGNAEDAILSVILRHSESMSSALDVDVILYDYAGYGVHTVRTPSERDSYEDVEAVWDHAVDIMHIPPETIVVWGRSLGSGPATHIASLHPTNIAGLVLQSPLTSAVGVVAPCLTGPIWNLFCCKCDMFDNYAIIHKIRRPVLIIHGTSDEVVPTRCGRTLFGALSPDAARSTSPLWVEGAGHNDVEAVAGWRYYEHLGTYFDMLRNTGGEKADRPPSEVEGLV